MEGTSNEAIINFFENETDDDLKKILSVFFRQTMQQDISFHKMMIEKKSLSVHNNEYRLKR